MTSVRPIEWCLVSCMTASSHRVRLKRTIGVRPNAFPGNMICAKARLSCDACCGSDEPFFRERNAAAVADDEVVEEPNLDEGEGVPQPRRDDFVGLARLGDAARMVVGENHGRGISRERLLDYLARMHARAVHGSAKQLLASRQPVAAVEEEAAEHLVLEVAKARDEIVARGARARQHGPRLQALEVMPAHQLERGLQLSPARGPDARLLADDVAAGRE